MRIFYTMQMNNNRFGLDKLICTFIVNSIYNAQLTVVTVAHAFSAIYCILHTKLYA